jgi:hypothetical protein
MRSRRELIFHVVTEKLIPSLPFKTGRTGFRAKALPMERMRAKKNAPRDREAFFS